MIYNKSADLKMSERPQELGHDGIRPDIKKFNGSLVPIQLHNSGGASSPSLAKEAENSSLR